MFSPDLGPTTLTASVAGVTKSVTTFVYAGRSPLNIVAFGGDAPPTPADCPDDLTSAVIDGNSRKLGTATRFLDSFLVFVICWACHVLRAWSSRVVGAISLSAETIAKTCFSRTTTGAFT